MRLARIKWTTNRETNQWNRNHNGQNRSVTNGKTRAIKGFWAKTHKGERVL